MDPANSLQQLKDIRLPSPIGWWPMAWGWWGLLTLFFVGSLMSAWLIRRRHRRLRPYHAAVVEFDRLVEEYHQHHNASQTALALSMLLKRLCFAYYPRAEIARLCQDRWQTFLGDTPWSQTLSYLCYQKQASYDVTPLFPEIRRCMKQLVRKGKCQHV